MDFNLCSVFGNLLTIMTYSNRDIGNFFTNHLLLPGSGTMISDILVPDRPKIFELSITYMDYSAFSHNGNLQSTIL
jgi:hypothetical protein